MAMVTADFHARERITFTARGRTAENVRVASTDGTGPLGFSSTELLLIAVGNCMLGTLLGAPLLESIEIPHAVATLEATMAPNPPRVVRIAAAVDLQTNDLPPGPFDDGLVDISCSCPMCNSLIAERVVTIRVVPAQ